MTDGEKVDGLHDCSEKNFDKTKKSYYMDVFRNAFIRMFLSIVNVERCSMHHDQEQSVSLYIF